MGHKSGLNFGQRYIDSDGLKISENFDLLLNIKQMKFSESSQFSINASNVEISDFLN